MDEHEASNQEILELIIIEVRNWCEEKLVVYEKMAKNEQSEIVQEIEKIKILMENLPVFTRSSEPRKNLDIVLQKCIEKRKVVFYSLFSYKTK